MASTAIGEGGGLFDGGGGGYMPDLYPSAYTSLTSVGRGVASRFAGAAADRWTQMVRPSLGIAISALSGATQGLLGNGDQLRPRGLLGDAVHPAALQACSEIANGPAEESVSRQIALAQSRVQHIGEKITERVGAAQVDLSEAFQLVDGSAVPSPTSRAATPSRSPQLLRQLKFAPLSIVELFGAEPWETARDGATPVASVGASAQRCWELWQQKHAALTASEQMYASLLQDSRRAGRLTAELRAVEALLRPCDGGSTSSTARPEQDSPTPAQEQDEKGQEEGEEQAEKQQDTPATMTTDEQRHQAMAACCEAMETQAKEAVAAFKERVGHYPCGTTSPLTGLLRIARLEVEVQRVLGAFEAAVAEETQEAMTQAVEIALAPSLGALTAAISKRLAFWEAEIEENWVLWSRQASLFHEACEGAAQAWSQLTCSVEAILAWLDAAPAPQEVPPIVYLMPLLDMKAMQQHRRWDDLHEALVEVAVVLATIGAWAEYHGLRGDGLVLQQARDLFRAVIVALDDPRFGSSVNGKGSEAVRAGLAASAAWCLVVPEMEAGSRCAKPWWSPSAWPSHCAQPPGESSISSNAPAGAELVVQ